MRPLGALLAAVLAVAVLTVATPGTAASAGVTSDPMAGAPAVGDCHDVTIRQAYADVLTEAPVRCSADHTLVVSGVRPVADDLDMSDVEAVADAAACHLRTYRLVGRDPLLRARTLYATFVFLPSAAQQEAGARWVSCHVAVWDSRGLNDLPRRLPRLREKPAAAVARCLDRRAEAVTCAERHTHRTTHTFFLRASGTEKAVRRKVEAKGGPVCASEAGRRGLMTWREHRPGKLIVQCAAKTTR